jgi:cytochrome c oxidase assembly protein subunit 15
MPDSPMTLERSSPRSSDILALGFGTTVAMWSIGYIGRLPGIDAPSWLVLALLLAALVTGGAAAGRASRRGVRGGVATGLLAAVLNLLILGSLLSGPDPNQIVPSALIWIPGSLLASAVLGGLGAAVTTRRGQPRLDLKAPPLARETTAPFATVAASATFLLLIAGGVVTSHEAGLAVVDWPNSYGCSMFLYPLSRMTGGIYYEHAHRLLGSLVGLTTLVLFAQLLRVDDRRWLKGLALVAFLAVILQGVLGGLRVTGRLTTSTAAEDMAPSTTFAVVHGVFGQLFFGLMTALAIVTTSRWRRERPQPHPAAGLDRALSKLLVGALAVQIALGALLRHTGEGLLIHICTAAVVIMLAVAVGVRLGALGRDLALWRRLAQGLFALVTLQAALGFAALIAAGAKRIGPSPPTIDVVLTTAHQAVGAILLASGVAAMLWMHRLSARMVTE